MHNEKISSEDEKRTKLFSEFQRSYKIVGYLSRAEVSKFYKHRIDTLEIKTLRMLEHLCYFRLDT